MHSLYKPLVGESGEFFINNTVALAEELNKYDRPEDRLLLLKKATSEFEHLNNLYRNAS